MRDKQSLPLIWLLSDARNDAQLEQALADLPRGSGFVFRHYHLPPDARRIIRRRTFLVICSTARSPQTSPYAQSHEPVLKISPSPSSPLSLS